MIPLACPAQTYAWGKKGATSLVAALKSAAGGFTTNDSQNYAELWMGTHPSGPSRILSSNLHLADWLTDKPQFVGNVPEGYPENDLPFLFKILSIRTALSIQAHPDKVLATRLHESDPGNYKDANHKPEMVIALTDFECVAGFRTVAAIKALLGGYPEFLHLLKLSGYDFMHDTSGTEPEVLRRLFSAYIRSKEVDYKFQLDILVERLEDEKAKKTLDSLGALLLKLNSQFPGDNGVFAPLMMNYLVMKPGDSFFICANEPHAYISGDCAECMALSDNVVRAGLTPKFKDVETLCSMLSYQSGAPSFLVPVHANSNTVIYRPPADKCAEFEVEKIAVPAGGQANLLKVPCASLLLQIEGENVSAVLKNPSAEFDNLGESCTIRRGVVLFLAAGSEIALSARTKPAIFLRAHINLST